MEGTRLQLQRPIEDAISRMRFAPRSNHLLISSWDSVLRLYDVDGSVLRLEATSEGALLDCCFHDESNAFSAGSDGCIRRYNMCTGSQSTLGSHDDSATCIEYSEATGQVITSGLDKKLIFWDTRMKDGNAEYRKIVDSDVWSLSLSGHYLLAVVGIMVNMYDLRNLKGPVQSEVSSMDYQIRCIRSFSNCQGYVVASIDGRVALKFFDPSKACEMGCVFRCHPKSKDKRYHLVAVNDIGFHPRHDTFVTGDNDGYAIIWDAQSRKRLFEKIAFWWLRQTVMDTLSYLSMAPEDNNRKYKLRGDVMFSHLPLSAMLSRKWKCLFHVLLMFSCAMVNTSVSVNFLKKYWYPSSVASISYNHNGQRLAIASSYTYQEANEVSVSLVCWQVSFECKNQNSELDCDSICLPYAREEAPQIFVHEMGDNLAKSFSSK